MTAADRDREALQAVLRWAEQRCPLGVDEHGEEDPGPCPLCGASIANLEPCKSAENTMPSDLLAKVRLALSSSTHARAQAGDPVAWAKAALDTLAAYEADLGEPLPDDHEIGRIDESQGSASFRIRVGHIRQLATHPAPAQEPVAVPAGFVLVPVEPTPGMLGAWYRHKSGYHAPGEPEPADTSDYGAYVAMLAAAPVSPAAYSGVEQCPTCGAMDHRTSCGLEGLDAGCDHPERVRQAEEDMRDIFGPALASHAPAPQPGGAGCPHCGGTGQRQDTVSALSPSPSGWDAGAEAAKHQIILEIEKREDTHDDPVRANEAGQIAQMIERLPLPTPAGEG